MLALALFKAISLNPPTNHFVEDLSRCCTVDLPVTHRPRTRQDNQCDWRNEPNLWRRHRIAIIEVGTLHSYYQHIQTLREIVSTVLSTCCNDGADFVVSCLLFNRVSCHVGYCILVLVLLQMLLVAHFMNFQLSFKAKNANCLCMHLQAKCHPHKRACIKAVSLRTSPPLANNTVSIP